MKNAKIKVPIYCHNCSESTVPYQCAQCGYPIQKVQSVLGLTTVRWIKGSF